MFFVGLMESWKEMPVVMEKCLPKQKKIIKWNQLKKISVKSHYKNNVVI